MPSSLKNPAVTHMLITLITAPLVSPCFLALVRCVLDISKSLKNQKCKCQRSYCAAAPLATRQGPAPFHSQFPVHSGLQMTLYSNPTPGPFHSFVVRGAAITEPAHWTVKFHFSSFSTLLSASCKKQCICKSYKSTFNCFQA